MRLLKKTCMSKSIYFLVFIMAFAFHSCDKKEPGEEFHYLIFGHFYGECIGEECVEIFKLDNENLYEDMNDRYPAAQDFYDGNFKIMDNRLFEKVKGLRSLFPDELLTMEDHVIGQPDAGDWGGLYIEYSADDLRKFWLIDQMKENTPAFLHPFIDSVNSKIAWLNQ